MFIKNKKQQKTAKIIYFTLSLLLAASQQIYAGLQESDQETRSSTTPTLSSKVAVLDGSFDTNSNTKNVLSRSTDNYFGKTPYKSALNWEDHANHVASIIHKGDPDTTLKVTNILNTSLEDAIDAAIASEASFINLSLSLKSGGISENLKKAFYRARDKGIGIIMAAGNDGEVIGLSAYTLSLASLVEEMKGSMVLVTATSGAEGQEKLASFSNKAGQASKYTISAPGTEILAYGALNKLVAKSGTSMAAPAVTAAASSLKRAYPDLSARKILELILGSARKTTVDQKVRFAEKEYGNGVLDYCAAHRRAEEFNNLKTSDNNYSKITLRTHQE